MKQSLDRSPDKAVLILKYKNHALIIFACLICFSWIAYDCFSVSSYVKLFGIRLNAFYSQLWSFFVSAFFASGAVAMFLVFLRRTFLGPYIVARSHTIRLSGGPAQLKIAWVNYKDISDFAFVENKGSGTMAIETRTQGRFLVHSSLCRNYTEFSQLIEIIEKKTAKAQNKLQS